MTEFGNLALIDQDAAEDSGVAIPLPGVRKGERKTRVLVGSPAGPGSQQCRSLVGLCPSVCEHS